MQPGERRWDTEAAIVWRLCVGESLLLSRVAIDVSIHACMAAVNPMCGSVRSREAARAVIQASASGQWLLIHGADEIGTFDSFGDAAARAVEEFGVGSYLVRTALASTVTLPASVVLQA